VTEIRRDPVTLRRVIVVPGRSARPNEHAATPPVVPSSAEGPFCEGNEARTPPEVAVVAEAGRRPNERGWQVRVIPNRFPTVSSDSTAPAAPSGPEVLERVPAFGFHEVLIESPSHSPILPFLPREQVVRVLRMARDRVRDLARRRSVGSVTLFENTGPESGGSLWHPHSQLVTTAGLSPSLEEELAGSERLRERLPAGCAFEWAREEETRDRTRVVFESPGFVGYCPFASIYPYEVRLFPRRHGSSFAEVTDEEVDDLADRLPAVLRALLAVVPGASYNYVVRSPVREGSDRDRYHWHLDLYPRLIRPDGFDVGSEFHVNFVTPEDGARNLRTELGAKL